MKCNACEMEVVGASKRDVLDLGWKFQIVAGGRERIWCAFCWDEQCVAVAMEKFDQELEKLLGGEK